MASSKSIPGRGGGSRFRRLDFTGRRSRGRPRAGVLFVVGVCIASVFVSTALSDAARAATARVEQDYDTYGEGSQDGNKWASHVDLDLVTTQWYKVSGPIKTCHWNQDLDFSQVDFFRVGWPQEWVDVHTEKIKTFLQNTMQVADSRSIVIRDRSGVLAYRNSGAYNTSTSKYCEDASLDSPDDHRRLINQGFRTLLGYLVGTIVGVVFAALFAAAAANPATAAFFDNPWGAAFAGCVTGVAIDVINRLVGTGNAGNWGSLLGSCFAGVALGGIGDKIARHFSETGILTFVNKVRAWGGQAAADLVSGFIAAFRNGLMFPPQP